MADGFEVRNPEIEDHLKGIGRAVAESEDHLKGIGRTIADVLPEGWGFTLLIFSFGEGGSTFYVSNAQRKDMLEALQEFMDKQANIAAGHAAGVSP